MALLLQLDVLLDCYNMIQVEIAPTTVISGRQRALFPMYGWTAEAMDEKLISAIGDRSSPAPRIYGFQS